MGNRTVIIVGVIAAGLVIVYVVLQSTSSATAASGLRSNTGNFWGFANNLLSDLTKAVPSWFEPGSRDTVTEAELNSYASSSGFADHG